MKSDNKITSEEKKEIYLRMLSEVDAFCRTHGIRYSLACGTLLGAIRHKGFIPWDDDLDIMMPRPDLERFRAEFVSDSIRMVDIECEQYYSFPFPRLTDLYTYSRPGKSLVGPGVEIDVYPVLGVPAEKEDIDRYFEKCGRLLKVRLALMKWRSRLIKRFPIKTIPFFGYVQRKYRNLVFKYPYGRNQYYLVDSGRLDWAHTYDFDLFASIVDVDFEGLKFLAISRYEEYLVQRYGDYLKLPPVECRRPYHGGVYYWR